MHLAGNRRWVPLFIMSRDQQSSCKLRFTCPEIHLTLPFGLKGLYIFNSCRGDTPSVSYLCLLSFKGTPSSWDPGCTPVLLSRSKLNLTKMSCDQNCFTALVQTTVEPPLTGTSPQRPLFFVPADSPYIDSYLKLSTTATATELRP